MSEWTFHETTSTIRNPLAESLFAFSEYSGASGLSQHNSELDGIRFGARFANSEPMSLPAPPGQEAGVFHTDADRSLFLLETEAEKGEFRSSGGCLP